MSKVIKLLRKIASPKPTENGEEISKDTVFDLEVGKKKGDGESASRHALVAEKKSEYFFLLEVFIDFVVIRRMCVLC